jgi:mono/diheme cytochrome c family protein
MRFTVPLVALALCVTTAATAAPSRALRGLAFAEQRCAACHAVRADGTSPNAEAPAWDDIANRPGTTERTLRTFLRDSHNYPAAMQFEVDRARIRDLSAYMATLRRKGYLPTR